MNIQPTMPEPDCPRCGSSAVRGGVCPACVFAGMLQEPPAAQPPAVPPRRVGEYDLIEELARGGMGVVWRARQRRLNREVALKFVLEGVLPGETVARRFRQEAEVAAQLSHPHIISVYEVGEADGRYFISMELAAGGTLAQRLQQERFTPRAAAALAGQLARAVQHAHDHGVLHRDLKPGNVLFDAAGEPRISDFGLARLATGGSILTLTGAVMGTPSYMAPEQARGESATLTTASDIYGLGTILYELLAGHPVFAGEVPVEVLRRVLDEQAPRLTGIARDLETICQKCLCKNPGDRYRSALALAEDLDRWLAGQAIHARRVSTVEHVVKWVRRHPLPAALWLALTVAAIIIAGLMVTSKVELAEARGAAEASATESQHRRADQHSTAAVLAIERGDSLRALPSLAEAIRIGTGDALRDRVNRIRFGTILRLAPVLEQVWYPAWVEDVHLPTVPDRVVICENHSVHLWRMSDGTAAVPRMDAGAPVLHAVLHPALPRVIAGAAAGGVQVWDAATGLHLCQKPGAFLRAPLLFPDGEHRLAIYTSNTARRFSPALLDFDGPVLEHPAAVEWAWLSPGGRRILTCAADRMIRVWDAETGTLIGVPQPCAAGSQLVAWQKGSGIVIIKPPDASGLKLDMETGGAASAFTALGDIRAASCTEVLTMLARSTRGGFVISGAEGGEVFVTATHGAQGNDARFSADSLRVFTRALDSGGRLWSTSSGRALTPFLWQGTDPLHVSLDAAADRILVSTRDPEVRLWHLRPHDGAASQTTLAPAAAQIEWLRHQVHEQSLKFPGAFSRRGERGQPDLVCQQPQDSALHVRDATTGRDFYPPLRHDASIVSAVVSPDGEKIASFTTSQCVYLWHAATGSRIGPLLRHDRTIDAIAFSPDSTLLATTGMHTLRVWEATAGTAVAPPMLHPAPLCRTWWSDDSSNVLTVDEQGRHRQWNVSPDQRPAASLDILARLYAAHQVTTGGALAPLSREDSRAAWEAVKNLTEAPPF